MNCKKTILFIFISAILTSCKDEEGVADSLAKEKIQGDNNLSNTEKTNIRAKTKHHLDQIILNNVALEKKTLEFCINFLNSRAIELDQEINPKKKGVSIVNYLNFNQKRISDLEQIDGILIDLVFDNVSLTKLLIEVAKQANCDLYVTSKGVIFCNATVPPFTSNKMDSGIIWKKLYSGSVMQME